MFISLRMLLVVSFCCLAAVAEEKAEEKKVVTFDDPLRAIARLAPHARCGHVRDFELRSIHQPDAYHRRGFEVLYRYPGEGVAPLPTLLSALVAAVGDRPYDLLIEGLDSREDVDDQHDRLSRSLPVVRRLLAEAAP